MASSVGVAGSVSVGAGSVTLSVIGEKVVFAGVSVATKVGGTEVDVELQANETSINRIGKRSFCLIR